MKIPLSWLREFAELPADCTPELIESAFVKVGFEVEEIILQGSDLTGPLVVARVESIEELTEHKKPIRYVGLDCGEGSTRYVICGARNFEQGDLVVAALPGAVAAASQVGLEVGGAADAVDAAGGTGEDASVVEFRGGG